MMKSAVFLEITPCNSCRRHLQGRRISQARNQLESSWRTEPTFNGLQGFLSQKAELVTTTAVRTLDTTWLYDVCIYICWANLIYVCIYAM
jgi:hypothetical protein